MAAHLPVESSWRMVEGANDSFDTSIVPTSFSQESEAGNDNAENTDPFSSSGSVPSSSQPPFYRPSLRETSTAGSRLASGVSSQDDQISLGGDDSFVSGSGSATGSTGASQEDDIHSFLRKAESDKNVLLRSPFQPSVPSSVRQSPLSVASSVHNRRADRGAYQTPEPELRMPVIGVDGSLDLADNGEERKTAISSKASSLAAAVLRRRGGFFGAADTGSPSQKRAAPGGSLLGQGISTSSEASKTQGSSGSYLPVRSPKSLVLIIALGLTAAYGAVVFATGSTTLGSISASPLYSTAASTLCFVPGISNRLAACSPDSSDSTGVSTLLRQGKTAVDDEPVSLVRSVGDLMRSQIQLATIVRTRVISSRHRNAAPVGADVPGSVVVPSFHDSWSLPQKRTKGLLAAARTHQKQSASDINTAKTALGFLREIEAYLGTTQRVSAALAKLQTGAFLIAADNQVSNTARIATQLHRINDEIKASTFASSEESDDSEPGWLSRLLLSSKGHISNKRRREMLADTYRHHIKTLLDKTQDRVNDAKAALAELETASKHLSVVQQYVDARVSSHANSIGSAPTDPNTPSAFSWLWGLLGMDNKANETAASTQWTAYAEQLDLLRHEHDATTNRIADALDELADVRDTLARLKARLSQDCSVVFSSYDLDLDMQLHIDVVDAGLQDLKGML